MLTTDCMAAEPQSVIRSDDILHSSLSFTAAASGSQLARGLGASRTDALLLGVGGAAALGLGKEAFDHLSYGGWSWRDITANAVGIAVAAGLQLCLDALSRRRANRGPRAGSPPRGDGLAARTSVECNLLLLDQGASYRYASGSRVSGGSGTMPGFQASGAGHNDAVHLDDAHFQQVPSPQENKAEPAAGNAWSGAVVARGMLRIGDGRPKSVDRADLLDIAGRRVMSLRPGELASGASGAVRHHDIRHVAPGVYFLREADSGGRSAVRKIVVQS